MASRRKQHAVPTGPGQITAQKVEASLTVLWNELAGWQQDNHYIHSGYRPASNSFRNSWASLLYLHNESVNIYSHFIGSVLMACVGLSLYQAFGSRYESANTGDIITIGCFFVSAVLCMGMSATYHTLGNHSLRIARLGNKLDYLGIVFLTTGSFIPCIYYGFNCHTSLRNTYWTMACLIGLGCAVACVFDRFRSPAWRPYRAGMFVAEGMSGFIPVLHALRLYSYEELQQRIGLNWIILEGFLYVLGAGLYAARWPERTFPGAFDIWGSSHQLFHLLVVMAAGSHVFAMMNAFDYHHGTFAYRC